MKIALIQMDVRAEDTEYNFAHAETLLCEAAEKADILVLPEAWNTGFFPRENIALLADKDAVRTRQLLSSVARRFGVSVIGGSVTEERDGRIYNTSYIYNEKGECISSYSKTHLFSYMDEQLYYTPGDGIHEFMTGGIKAAVVICYDLRFPELVRRAAARGVTLLLAVCQWPLERTELMHILGRGRAVENQMYVAVCNATGEAYGTRFGGGSVLIDPLGNITALGGEGEQLIFGEIDVSSAEELRNKFKVFSDRRPELY